MHACALVLIPDTFEGIGGRVDVDLTQDAGAQVEELMAPWYVGENSDDGWWDWWVIGGRFTGLLSGYDPKQDPVNQEICTTCNGTGTRPGGLEEFGAKWLAWVKGCNGCLGTGHTTKWRLAPHDGDIQIADAVLRWMDQNPEEGAPCYTILSADGVHHRKTWDSDKEDYIHNPGFEQVVRDMLQKHLGRRVVVVDYHS
jgi:hypothetical protein